MSTFHFKALRLYLICSLAYACIPSSLLYAEEQVDDCSLIDDSTEITRGSCNRQNCDRRQCRKDKCDDKCNREGSQQQTARPPLYGIITAFAPEIAEFTRLFDANFGTVEYAGRRFFQGVLCGKQVVITVCGIGMTNSAQTTQLMIDRFNPDYLLFSGIAGGVNDDTTNVGDVVIVQRWAENQHQKFIRQNANFSNFIDFAIDFPDIFYRIAANRVPSFFRPSCNACDNPDPSFTPAQDGVIVPGGPVKTSHFAIPMLVEVLRDGDDAFQPVVPQQFWFNVDQSLLDAARQTIGRVTLQDTGIDPTTGQPVTLNPKPQIKIGTAGVSASTFVDNAEYRADVQRIFNADILDMETAAFAHVAVSNRKPFLAIRSVSDLAGGDEGLNVILTFIGLAASNSTRVTCELLKIHNPENVAPAPQV
jgi:adenosylhomocysteine nucleosidase